jgi:FkbM family methyltransferase
MFRRPWRVLLAEAVGWPGPLTLDLQAGGRVRVSNVRQLHAWFDWLLECSPDPLPVTAVGGCLTFRHAAARICLRPTAGDFEVFQEVFLRDAYRLEELSAATTLGTVLDLGAHVGLFAVRVAAQAERVICVEPAADNAEVLERNLQLNALGDKVRLHRAALSDGLWPRVALFRSRHSYGHSLHVAYAARWGAPRSEEVPAIGLAELFEREQLDRCGLVKCDLEGAEYAVFEAAPVDLLRRIDRLIIEVHLLRPQVEEPQLRQLAGKLREAGFIVELEDPRDEHGRRRPWMLLFANR